MSRSFNLRATRLLILFIPTLLIAGCPVDSTLIDTPAALAGTYWVEYADQTLSVFELPEYRGEEGVWHTFEIAVPDWYTGPALYEVNDDGSWQRLTDDPDLTLDEVLMLYDPPPAP